MRPNKATISGVAALALCFCLAWCLSSPAKTMRTGIPDRGSTLVFGYLPQVFYNVDPRDVTGLMEAWTRVVEEKLHSNVKTTNIAYTTITEAEKDLANKKVDMLVMIPEDFIRLRAKYRL